MKLNKLTYLISVNQYIFIVFKIAIAIAANKSDLYEKEQVEDDEGQQLAKEIGAIFQRTSAKDSTGINELFVKLGKKILESSTKDRENTFEEVEKKKKKSIKLNNNSNNTKKKGCC